MKLKTSGLKLTSYRYQLEGLVSRALQAQSDFGVGQPTHGKILLLRILMLKHTDSPMEVDAATAVDRMYYSNKCWENWDPQYWVLE